MVENSRSSGVATDDAIVSGLAPGTKALTEMVGYSTLGSAATGSARNAMTPNNRIANVTSAVITGRSMKISRQVHCFPDSMLPVRPP